jgi:hypothetical protein
MKLENNMYIKMAKILQCRQQPFLYIGRIDMKNLIFKTIILVLILSFPIPTMASGRMEVGVSIPMPPAVVFVGPPHVVVIPETYVYVVSDIDDDIFFYDGWRNDYNQNRWKGRQWEHQRIPHEQVEKDWGVWEKNRHWEKQNNWGVHDRRPETGPRRQNDGDPQQEARDRQRLGNDYPENNQDRRPDDRRERRQSRDEVESEQSWPQQRDHDRRKRHKDDRD